MERVDVIKIWCFLSSFLCSELGRDHTSLSLIGMVLAVEVGLKDGMDSISVFIIHPSWNTEHGSSETGY